MDFLDPEKKRAHKIRLIVGYVLIGVLIILASIVLLYQAYGYGFDKNGQLIQNGLVFVNSSPNPADIYLNGILSTAKTNTRLVLPAGQYTLELKRTGYRTWVRAVGVEGGSVERFDYPLLFPNSLTSTIVREYAAQPGLITQSPDHRWLLLQRTNSQTDFDLYDLNDRQQAAVPLVLPAGLLSQTTDPSQHWQLIEWSADSRHLLLQHQSQTGSEYVMVDRQTPASSVNLTKALNLTASNQLSLRNKQFDQYYVYNSANTSLSSMSLKLPVLTPLLSGVLTFKSYGNDVILYASNIGAPTDQTYIKVFQGNRNYRLRSVAAGGQYLLDVAQYNGKWFIAAGATNEDRVYVYQDPVAMLQDHPTQPLVPVDIMKVVKPNYLSFSSSTRFIMVENNQSFVVYDAENNKSYSYQLTIPVDNGTHAAWMDGSRLTLTSGGKIIVFDYDDANQQTLNTTVAGALPFFNRDSTWLYTLAPAAISPHVDLTNTPLTTPAIP